MNAQNIFSLSLRAGALALAAFASGALRAGDVTDGDVPAVMDVGGTHYVIGATGAYNRDLGIASPFYQFIAGQYHPVTLTVQNGSHLSTYNIDSIIGYLSGSDGSSVLVTGSGSTWTMTGLLDVGANAGSNTLTIANGGAVSMNGGRVGDGGPGVNNTLTITGAGSSWTDAGWTVVGVFGANNSMSIEDGATATSATADIGFRETASGNVIVSGTGSAWTIAGALSAGFKGTGTLTVEDGGFVGAGALTFANVAGSNTTLTLATGGTLQSTEELALGVEAGATSTVNLNTGGTLEIADHGSAAIAAGAGSVAFNFAGGTLKVRSDAGGGVLTTSVPMTLSNSSTVDTNGNTATLSGVLSGAGSLTKSGAGTLTLSGANTYTGPTSITGGELKLNGSAAASAFTVSGGILSGGGTVGTLTIASGGTLAPGNSPGTMSADSATFEGGGTFTWEINAVPNGANANGVAGANPGWDLLSVSGALTVTATSESQFALHLTSLTLGNLAGNVSDFDPAANYSFVFATTTGGITGFASNAFTLDTSAFSNPYDGTWSIGLANDAHDLALNYTGMSAIPEPSTYAAWAGAVMFAFVTWRRRRRGGAPVSTAA